MMAETCRGLRERIERRLDVWVGDGRDDAVDRLITDVALSVLDAVFDEIPPRWRSAESERGHDGGYALGLRLAHEAIERLRAQLTADGHS